MFHLTLFCLHCRFFSRSAFFSLLTDNSVSYLTLCESKAPAYLAFRCCLGLPFWFAELLLLHFLVRGLWWEQDSETKTNQPGEWLVYTVDKKLRHQNFWVKYLLYFLTVIFDLYQCPTPSFVKPQPKLTKMAEQRSKNAWTTQNA